jgi:hypothetical protein
MRTGETALPVTHRPETSGCVSTMVTDSLTLEGAKDHGIINGRSRVLLGFDGGNRGHIPLEHPRDYGLRPAMPDSGHDSGVRGQLEHGVHQMGESRYRGRGSCQAHRNPEAFRTLSDAEWSDAADPRFNGVPASGHLDQASPVRRGHPGQDDLRTILLSDLCPQDSSQEGELALRLSSRVTSVLKRGVSQTGGAE